MFIRHQGWVEWVEPGGGQPGYLLNGEPWYSRTDITCPRCSTTFHLDEGDFQTALTDPNITWPAFPGYQGGLRWVKFTNAGTAITYQSGAPLFYDPDQVGGWCPTCGYNFGVVGPHWNLPKDDPNNAAVIRQDRGLIQYMKQWDDPLTYAQFRFIDTYGTLAMSYLMSSSIPPHVEADGTVWTMIRMPEKGPNVFTFQYLVPFAGPTHILSRDEVITLDYDWVTAIERMGITIVGIVNAD